MVSKITTKTTLFIITVSLLLTAFASPNIANARELTLPGPDSTCEWRVFIEPFGHTSMARARNGCGVGINAISTPGDFNADCGGIDLLNQHLAAAKEDDYATLISKKHPTSRGAWNFVHCCCPKPTGADTESVIGGAVWANPFDSLQVKIPGLTGFSEPVCGRKVCSNIKKICTQDADCGTGTCEEVKGGERCFVPWIGEYIKALYNYGIGIAGILALIAILIGGLLWLTSGGSASKITVAKSWITGGITGLVILMASYILLSQINSKLVNLDAVGVDLLETSVQCPEDLARQGKCTSCHECVQLNVPVKANMGNSANSALAQKLYKAYQAQGGWEVTEAWPPTVAHSNDCHANGTCVDVGVRGNDTPENVKKISDALAAQGLRVVFETNKSCADYSGITCRDTSNNAYKHITGPHFSVYYP